jgi:F0F1-type ATP synthase assembly protein I
MFRFKPEDLSGITLAVRLALTIVLMLLGCGYLGWQLGRQAGSELAGIMLGVLVGLYAGFRQAIRMLLKK